MIFEFFSRIFGVYNVRKIVKILGEPLYVDVLFRAKNVYLPTVLEVTSEIVHSIHNHVSLISSQTLFITKNGDYKSTVILDTSKLNPQVEGNYNLKIKISGFGKVFFEKEFKNAVELTSTKAIFKIIDYELY